VFHATVIEVTQGRNRTLHFHFDNGQVWRQMEARHLEYPRNVEFDINITRGMMGDYRMRIGDDGRMVGENPARKIVAIGIFAYTILRAQLAQ